ncbi:MAG: cation:proton antiporter [Acidobacteriota bacterium]
MTDSAVSTLLAQATLLLGAAVVVLLASHRLRLPPVVGLLLTGMLIGPSGLGWISDLRRVETSAEIGVLLLLFTIGIEVSLGELRDLARPFRVGGSIQTAASVALAAGLALAFGRSWREALVLGFVAAPSSTAVVLKLYRDRGELRSPHGRSALGILVFQDVMLVPMLVALPLLVPGGGVSPGRLLQLGAATLAGAALFAAARWILPRLLERVARTRIREVFLFGALFTCLGLSWASEALGFTLGLGAFVAGLLVAESGYRSQVIADVEPFRDLFASLFFVSIGMLVDLGATVRRLPEVATFVVLLLAVKLVATAVAVRRVGYPARTVTQTSFALAQIGEFSFVIAASAGVLGLLSRELQPLVITTAVVTLLATPGLVAIAPWVADRLPGPLDRLLAGRPGRVPETAGQPSRELRDHVVVVGFGAGGQTLAKVLLEAGVRYRVVEADAEIVESGWRREEPIVYGDATRPEILRAAGLATARLAVLAISDPEATRRALVHARAIAPHIHLLVRTRRIAEIESLRSAGADEVIAEEFESSIEMFTRVLEAYHVPRNIIRAQTRVLRGEGYEMLRAPGIPGRVSGAVLAALAAGTTEVVRVEAGSPACGLTLGELDLRRRSGATVIAVVRGEHSQPNPAADFRLAPGDDLVLVGSHAEIEAALVQLEPVAPHAPESSI